MERRETIGPIGIGLVGTALAEDLFAAGYEVIGFARSEWSRAKLARLGGRAAASPLEIGQTAERIILSLPDSNVVEDVVLGLGSPFADSSAVLLALRRLRRNQGAG